MRAVVADCGFARMDGPIQKRLETLFGEPMGQAHLAPATQTIGERLLGSPATRIAPEEAIGKIAPRPVLTGSRNPRCLGHPRPCPSACTQPPGENAQLWLIEGCRAIRSCVHTAPDYAKRVVAFLKDAV